MGVCLCIRIGGVRDKFSQLHNVTCIQDIIFSVKYKLPCTCVISPRPSIYISLPCYVYYSGYWLSPDFSQCRLKAGTRPFVLLWLTFAFSSTRHWQSSFAEGAIREVCEQMQGHEYPYIIKISAY